MDFNLLKSFCLGILLVISIICGLLPLKLKHIKEWIATGLACFCGGLLLGVCFLDFLPSVRSPGNKTSSSSYPIAELLVMTGFLVVLMLDKLAEILSCQLKSRKLADGCTTKKCSSKDSNNAIIKPVIDDEKTPLVTSSTFVIISSATNIPTYDCRNPTHGVMRTLRNRSNCCQLWLSSETLGTTVKSIALVAAVTVHSILEGMVLGLEESVVPLIRLTALITFHKSLIIFSVGVTLNDQKIPFGLYIREIVLLCLASPAGAIVGMAVTTIEPGIEESPTAFTLKCLATGTFIFVTFFEILSRKLMVKRWKDFVNVLVCIVGFACFAGLAAIPGHKK